jgi:hypothetical protein
MEEADPYSRDLGVFELSHQAVLGEPGKTCDELVELEALRPGAWLAIVQRYEDGPLEGQLESILAVHTSSLDEDFAWRWIEQPLSTESGLLGVFDRQGHRPFSFPFEWSLLPHGFAHQTRIGAGNFDASVALENDEVIAIEILMGSSEDDR